MTTDGFQCHIGAALVFGLIWTNAAMGDDPLFPGVQYAAGYAPASVAIHDLNGDQMPDLAVANWWSDDVTVLLNQRPTPGDFDGDGDVDLDDFSEWFHCMGGPKTPPRAAGCEALDWNHDGDVDLSDFALFAQHFGGSL